MIQFDPIYAKECIGTALHETRYILRAHDLPKEVRHAIEDAERGLMEAQDKISRCARNPESYSDGNGHQV